MDEDKLKGYIDSMVTEYDKRVIGNYFLKEGMEKGIEIGMEKGKEKGDKNASLRIAKAMLVKRGMSIEDVCELTGLSAEEVGKLIS